MKNRWRDIEHALIKLLLPAAWGATVFVVLYYVYCVIEEVPWSTRDHVVMFLVLSSFVILLSRKRTLGKDVEV